MQSSQNRRISVNIVACERVLKEEDGALSAIRIVDVFYYKALPGIAPEQQKVPVSLAVSGRFPLEDDAEHTIQLKIVDPHGETTQIGEIPRQAYPRKIAEAPSGFSLAIPLGVPPTLLGTYIVIVLVDGEEKASAQFTIIERQAQTEVPK